MKLVFVGSLALLSLACGRSSQESGSAAPSASGAVPVVSVAAANSGAPSASASSAGASGAPSHWKGSYKTTPGALAVPAGWKGTTMPTVDPTVGVGDGTIEIVIDPATRRVTGTLAGAAGPAVLEGSVSGAELSAAVRRQTPTDKGLAGTLLATVSADKIAGTLTLSSADGATLRTGTFTLTADAH